MSELPANRSLQTLGELMLAEEARLLAEARREIAEENATWEAFSDEERTKVVAEREARWDALAEACSSGEDEDEEEEEDED